MNWKDILKMPMPLGTRAARDEDHKQAITEYEKSVIEPKLVTLVQSQPALEGKETYIGFRNEPSDKTGLSNNNSPFYLIGTDGRDKLGQNISYILQIISDIYRAEGWTIRNTSFDGIDAIAVKEGPK
jgi:hypothetical protein